MVIVSAATWTVTTCPAWMRPRAIFCVLDLYDRLSDGWTLIGGQLVHLHCAERG
jgi:hypothetical protein